MNLPNKLTLGRILCVPLFIVLYLKDYYVAATVVFCLAAATDALDGYLARKYHLVTNFGKIMDPLADKVLVIAAFVCMVQEQVVPGWVVILILTREFAIAGLRTVAAAEGKVIAAGVTGKIKTILQMIAIPLLLLQNWPFALIGVPADQIFLWASVVMTVVSGVEYIYQNRGIVIEGGI